MSEKDFVGWKLFDTVILVCRDAYDYEGNNCPLAYVVPKDNKEMLERAREWAHWVERSEYVPGIGYSIVEEHTATEYEYDNKNFVLELHDVAKVQFVQELKSLPSRGFAYRMNFRIYTFRQQANDSGLPTGESVWTATHRQHLTADIFPHLVAYICYWHIMNNATPFTLDTETIRHYNLAQKDVMALTTLIEQCNESLKKEMNNE